MRLPSGYGSVYKLSGKRRRPWIAIVTEGWDDEGKQLRKPIGYFATKMEALDALSVYRQNPIAPKEDITLGEIYDEWSEDKYEIISKSTADNYRAAWKYLKKHKNVKFKDLRTAQFQRIINNAHKDGMSKSHLTKIKALSTSLYKYAMINDIVNKNYAEFVEIPSYERKEKEIFTDMDIKRMLENADKVPWVDTILIMIYTGARISEMLTLTKFNIDLDKQVITGGIKTDAGKNRAIPIHPKIIKHVVKWYNKNGDTLICKDDGKKMTAKYYREKYYYPALEALGIEKKVPHTCRHTFASMLSAAGADTVAIQKLIGHSDYSTTANIYTHLDIEELRKAINKL